MADGQKTLRCGRFLRKVFLSFASVNIAIVFAETLPFEGINEFQDEYRLPELPFGYEELQPLLDGATVEVHHRGHHAAYTRKMNAGLQEWRTDDEDSEAELSQSSILEIMRQIEMVPEKYFDIIRNNGGGFVNHNIYWSGLSANPRQKQRFPSGKLKKDIDSAFGTFQDFQLKFTQEATNLFGSGYVWLSREPFGDQLVISRTTNQDSVISDDLDPILVLDVWEHAYYLKHQNKRPKYIDDWWLLVDWTRVEKLDNWWRYLRNKHDEL